MLDIILTKKALDNYIDLKACIVHKNREVQTKYHTWIEKRKFYSYRNEAYISKQARQAQLAFLTNKIIRTHYLLHLACLHTI